MLTTGHKRSTRSSASRRSAATRGFCSRTAEPALQPLDQDRMACPVDEVDPGLAELGAAGGPRHEDPRAPADPAERDRLVARMPGHRPRLATARRDEVSRLGLALPGPLPEVRLRVGREQELPPT